MSAQSRSIGSGSSTRGVHPHAVDDAVHDLPAASFEPLLRVEKDLAAPGVDRLVNLDPPELAVRMPLVPETRHENSLEGLGALFQAVDLVGIV